MKQSLQMKMGQSLAMTPQLQQAIKLLQLSTLELQSEIQEALESNPMLEMQEEDGGEPREGDSADDGGAALETRRPTRADSGESSADGAADFETGVDSGGLDGHAGHVMPEDLPVDSAWEDVYEPTAPSSAGSGASDGETRDFTEFHNAGVTSIQDHLNEQIRFAPLSEKRPAHRRDDHRRDRRQRLPDRRRRRR